MNLSDLVTAVRANLGGRTDKDALIKAQLNAGHRQICQRHRFKPMIFDADLTITEGVSQVPLPPNAAQVLEVRLINGTLSYKLPIVPKQTAVARFPNTGAYMTGYPILAYEEGGSLYLCPRPTSGTWTLQGTFLVNPVDLVADTDKPMIPEIENALIAYATGMVMASLEKFQEGSYWNGIYEKERSALVEADKRKPATELRMQMHNGRTRNPFSEVFGSAFAGFPPGRRY